MQEFPPDDLSVKQLMEIGEDTGEHIGVCFNMYDVDSLFQI